MFKPIEKSYIFIPGTENHFSSFLPVANQLDRQGFSGFILRVDEFITNDRKFGNDEVIKISMGDLMSSILNWPVDVVIIVGNDSDREISKILIKARRRGIKVALMQDGWLDFVNIKKPIYNSKGVLAPIKKILHVFLTQNWMPTKPYFHNLIGQNSDIFLVYSEIAKQNFIKANVNPTNIFITGSPRHYLLRSELKNTLNGKQDAIVIFSTSINNEFDRVITELGMAMVTEMFPNQVIIIKLHPSEDLSKYIGFIKKNVFVEKCHLKDILLKYSIKLSFCFASTVVFDMLMLDIPIIQLAPNNADKTSTNYYNELGVAKNKQELFHLIETYDLAEIKKYAAKYLSDINYSFNSINETIKVLTKCTRG